MTFRPFIDFATVPRSRLIATRLPEGKKLFVKPGVAKEEGLDRLAEFARNHGATEFVIVPAESVGLEWHNDHGLMKMDPAGWFCVLVPLSAPD